MNSNRDAQDGTQRKQRRRSTSLTSSPGNSSRDTYQLRKQQNFSQGANSQSEEASPKQEENAETTEHEEIENTNKMEEDKAKPELPPRRSRKSSNTVSSDEPVRHSSKIRDDYYGKYRRRSKRRSKSASKSVETSTDEPAVETSTDEPAVETSTDEPAVETSTDEPVTNESELLGAVYVQPSNESIGLPKSPQPKRINEEQEFFNLSMPYIYLPSGKEVASPEAYLREDDNQLAEKENTFSVPSKLYLFPTEETKEESNCMLSCKHLPCTTLERFTTPMDQKTWKLSQQKGKFDLPTVLRRSFEGSIYPQMQIVINGEVYRCHSLVLRAFSSFFRQLPTAKVVHLPIERVSQRAFLSIYEWLLKDKVVVDFEVLLEIFSAAKFLGMQKLIDICWENCENTKNSEMNAALFHHTAKQYGLHIEDLMFGRICKFFLHYVASKEYQELSINEVTNLLERNTIGVNTEMEVFMAGVVWLYYDWPRRQMYVERILACIRFTLMPFLFLLTFRKRKENPVIDYMLQLDVIEERINEGILVGHDMVDCRHAPKSVGQRIWIYDADCEYHHTEPCNQYLYLSYTQFLDYLEKLQKLDLNHWRTVKMCDDPDIRCCCKQKREDLNDNCT